MPMGLTAKQRAALDYIIAFIGEHRISPRVDDIRVHLGLASKAGAHEVVTALKDRGHIDFLPQRARSIVVLDQSPPPINPIPLPPAVKAELDAFCREHGEDPLSVIADAVVLHLDSLQPHQEAA